MLRLIFWLISIPKPIKIFTDFYLMNQPLLQFNANRLNGVSLANSAKNWVYAQPYVSVRTQSKWEWNSTVSIVLWDLITFSASMSSFAKVLCKCLVFLSVLFIYVVFSLSRVSIQVWCLNIIMIGAFVTSSIILHGALFYSGPCLNDFCSSLLKVYAWFVRFSLLYYVILQQRKWVVIVSTLLSLSL